jgi:excisionase family DNA binding protein
MEKLLTMKEAKELLGVQTRAIQEWDRQGKIRTVRTVGGRRRIPESEILRLQGLKKDDKRRIIGYTRVSSNTDRQKDDLSRQIEVIKTKGIKEEDIFVDIGSGLNENRRNFKKLIKLVLSGDVSKIIISYPDRLTRFGYETLKEIFLHFGTEIETINEPVYRTPQEEMVEDLITIITHFSGMLYGMRSHKQKELIENAKSHIEQNKDLLIKEEDIIKFPEEK